MNANGYYETEITQGVSSGDPSSAPERADLGSAEGPRPAGSRRRGAALLDAIYSAVLAELTEGSLHGLTMERIAERARTGKAALYRRWASREELIIDTLHCALPDVSERAGDALEGDTRDRLLFLLGEMTAALSGPEGAVARHVLAELHHSDELRTALTERLVRPRQQMLLDVFAAGVERGEVRPEAVTPAVAQAGPALLLYRFFIFGAVSYTDTVTVVDEVVMPLLRPTHGGT